MTVSTKLPTPNELGWYIYRVGDSIRCPGPSRRPGPVCNCLKYRGTVTEGEVWVRPDVRLHEGLERRQHPRFTDVCPRNHGGCGTPLEIETRSAPQAAA